MSEDFKPLTKHMKRVRGEKFNFSESSVCSAVMGFHNVGYFMTGGEQCSCCREFADILSDERLYCPECEYKHWFPVFFEDDVKGDECVGVEGVKMACIRCGGFGCDEVRENELE